MRFRELRTLVEQLVAGGGKLQYADAQPPDFTAAGTGGAIDTLDPTADALVIVSATVAAGSVGIDVDGVTVGFSAIDGQQVLTAEVPAGSQYSVYKAGAGTSVDNIAEVPRS